MTNYNDWDKKASQLVKDAEDDDEEEKKKADEALGLTDGPQGPPVAKAKAQRKKMEGHSENRSNFIAEQQKREQVITHAGAEAPIEIVDETQDCALRIRGSKDVTYVIGQKVTLLKLFIEKCVNVRVIIGCHIKTQFVEINHSDSVEVRCETPVSTFQCDECTKGYLRIIFMEPENMGTFFHQNCPALEVAVIGQDPVKVGVASEVQLHTRPGENGVLDTEDVIRGEKEFPLNLNRHRGSRPVEEEFGGHEATEESQIRAEEKRQEGNEAFRASDFLQAAVYYTESIQHDPTKHLPYANRAQCFLKTGQPDRALEDATKCTELAPDYAKGWFRKGMALHAVEKFGPAIVAFTEAEKLDPKNHQIPDAVKMAQLMARRKGPGADMDSLS